MEILALVQVGGCMGFEQRGTEMYRGWCVVYSGLGTGSQAWTRL